MKLNILLLLSLFWFSNILSQEKKYSVDYTLYFAEPDELESSEYSRVMAQVYKKSGDIKFNLFVNDSVSYFIVEDGINNSDLSTKLAISKPLYTTPVYSNLKTDKLYYNNNPNFIFFKENQYLIEQNAVSNWEIKQETKTIDGRICYKAISKDNYYYHNKDKVVYFDVTAWFCPEIPIKAGPVFYNNLPGLIMEISYLDVRLEATKIKFDFNEKSIKTPKGKSIVDYDEYNKIQEKILKEKYQELEKRERSRHN
ncbi:MAG: GLPGLI family protein [Flavobacteriaceae bacterium]|jgi:GLPGLI family protein|nr:GLPGLI family protein [Flavobacteriaceae bacterium]